MDPGQNAEAMGIAVDRGRVAAGEGAQGAKR